MKVMRLIGVAVLAIAVGLTSYSVGFKAGYGEGRIKGQEDIWDNLLYQKACKFYDIKPEGNKSPPTTTPQQ